MKYLKLFVTLTVLVLFVASLSFAGIASKAATTTPGYDAMKGQIKVLDAATKSQLKSTLSKSSKVEQLSIEESDLAPQFRKPASASKKFDRNAMAKSSPTPKIDVSAVDPLAGTYQVPGDFSSIGAAVAVLNYVGLSADVTFELTASSYTENSITFGSYDGNGDYSVTVKPATGVAATINFVSSNSDGKGFAFNGAENVTIDGVGSGGSSLAIQYGPTAVFPLADGFGATIYITGASYNITVKNASIEGIVNTPVWADQTEGRPAIFIWRATADPLYNESIYFDNLTITNATYGIKALPQTPAISVVDLEFTNCRVGSAYGDGVAIGGFLEYPTIVNYSNNIFDGITFLQNYWYNPYTEFDVDVAFGVGAIMFNLGQSTATHLIGTDACVFSDNILRNVGTTSIAGDGILTYGTRVSQANNGPNVPAMTTNNIVYNLTNPGGTGSQINGIRGTAGHVWHNSVRLTGVSDAVMTSNCLNGTTDAYNNALSNELTGGTASLKRAIAQGGVVDYNAIYSTGYFISALSTANAAIAGGINANGIFGPVGFNADLTISTGPSSAENMGKSHVLPLTDYAGTSRDTTDAGTRDAGAYEFGPLGAPFGPDLIASGFLTPPAAVPFGVAQAPKVRVKNNSNVATGSFDVHVTSDDGYDQTVNVTSLGAQASTDVTFPNWNPAAAPSSVLLTASAAIAGDINAANDSAKKTISVTNPVVLVDSTFRWNSSDEGWSRVIDWARSSTFTKLGGPFNGASMVVQRPNDISKYTEGGYANTSGYATTYPGANFLTSDWYDLSTIPGTDLYISFFHTLKTESIWDRSWVEYTTDGLTWHQIGVCNDPNGLNWYDDAVYPQACTPLVDGDNFDATTAALYGLNNIVYSPAVFPGWTSDADETTPAGWVYNSIKLTTGDYPTRATAIKFRYVAFSDASYSPAGGGWAVDNFRIAGTPNPLLGGLISGKVFHDLDADGVFNNADTAFAGVTVVASSGTPLDTMTTDVNGDYTFNISANDDLPGLYTMTVNLPGYGFTVPSTGSNAAGVSHLSDGNTVTQNFGAFIGSVSGTVFSDLNNDSTRDGGEPGLSGWSVEIRKSTVGGTLVTTAVTDVDGNYTVNLPPFATYFVKVIKQNTISRKTMPAADSAYSFSISGASGSGTAVVTGKDFGFFKYATIKLAANIDFDGSGTITSAGELNIGLPAGVFVNFEVFKNTTRIDSVTLGNGTSFANYSGLELGTYVFHQLNVPEGWYVTNGSLYDTVIVNSSGQTDSVRNLFFKYVAYSGTKFNDLDGDGVKDGGEPGLAGWTINVSGNGGGSAVTDSNGNFSFTTLGPDSHYVTETAQSGWTQTKPSSPYAFKSLSASSPGQDKAGLDFGNFQNYSISGMVYRDYNGDGTMNGADAGVDGITVSLTGKPNATTAGGGLFTFTAVANGAKTATVTAPVGFSVTEGSSNYVITGVSGTNVTGKNFGLFQGADTAKYRTFTLDSMQQVGLRKVTKKKVGTFPNLLDALTDLYKQAKDSSWATGIIVGEAGNKLDPTNLKSAEKGYIKPDKASAIQATLYKKGKTGALYQTGTARGLDFLTGNVARITKLNKSIGPDKHSNALVGNMMTLGINLAFSDFGKTPAGLGDLVYVGTNEDYQDMSIAEIYAAGNDMITNWEGLTSAQFSGLNAVVAAINAEFASATVDTAAWLTGKLSYTGVKAISASSILRAGTGIAPTRQIPTEEYPETPTVFTLGQNYPNPFNPTTNIRFALPAEGVVSIKVYNMLGQEVANVLENETYFDGEYEVSFDASSLTSGVYFYRVSVDITDSETGAVQHVTQTKKMLLTK